MPPDPKAGLDAVDRLQSAWDKGWQSATAGVLTILLLVVLFLLLRSQHLRVKDREKADARYDSLIARTDALAKETGAIVAENGKQLFVFARALADVGQAVADLKKAVGEGR